MRPVMVFMDVQGVLDNPNASAYTRVSPLRLLEATVLSLPDVFVVLGFQTAEEAPVQDLIAQCSAEMRERLAGVFVHEPSKKHSRGSREKAALAWLLAQGVRNPQWVAVDDQPDLWSSLHQVVDVNPDVGFNEDVAVRLSAMIALWRLPQDLLNAPVAGAPTAATKSAKVPLGIRVKHAVCVEWDEATRQGTLQLSGEPGSLAFTNQTLKGLDAPEKGMKLRVWLNRQRQVVGVLPA